MNTISSEIHKYTERLAQLSIAHKTFTHAPLQPISALLEYLGFSFSQSMPTLIMKADDYFLALLLMGDCRIDSKKVKKFLGVKSLRMATPEEFIALTNLPIGAARVYIPGLKTLIDKKVLEEEYLIGGSGSFECSIQYKTSDLQTIPDSSFADISQN